MVIGKVGVWWTQELRSGAPEPHIPPGKGRWWSPTPQSCEGSVGRMGAAAAGHEPGWAPGAGRTCTPRGAAPSPRTRESCELSILPPRHHPGLVSLCHDCKPFLSATLGRTTPKVKAAPWHAAGRKTRPSAFGLLFIHDHRSAQAFGVNGPFHTDNWGS